MIPIKQLHEMKKLHPDLDIPSYLNRISSAFRRFVLDTLNKLGKILTDHVQSSSIEIDCDIEP